MAAENVGFFLLKFLVWPISTTMPKIRLGPKCVSQADLRCRTIIEGKPLPLQKTNNKQPPPPPPKKKKNKKQKKKKKKKNKTKQNKTKKTKKKPQ